MIKYLFMVAMCLCCIACGSSESKVVVKTKLDVPLPPVIMTDPLDRASFLASHYWDNYDFTDTALVHNADFTEQGLSNYIDVLRQAPPADAANGIKSLLSKAMAGDSVVFAGFVKLCENYLGDPNSPMRNEELYIPVLEYIVASPKVSDLDKIRPRALLDIAMKNRPGMVATDIDYSLRGGGKGRLHAINSNYVLLYFNEPGCPDCRRVKEYILASPLFERYISSAEMKVVALYPFGNVALWRATEYPKGWINGNNPALETNGVYCVTAVPSLYLLDKDKRVLIKDGTVEMIEGYLAAKEQQ